MKKQTIEGILGTIIFHMVVAIIFMLLKLSSIEKIDEEGFIIIFEENIEELLKIQDQQENIQMGNDQLRRNIAVNQEQEKKEISAEENLRRILSSMKNFNEQAEEMLENDDNYDLDAELQEKIKDRSMIDSSLLIAEEQRLKEESEYYYEGPTNIYYTLTNRTHVYLHIPVYKCESAGKVSLVFDVNRDGTVISATYNRNETNTMDDCLLKAAKESIMKTRFNQDSRAMQNQTGEITYLFVAQ